MLRNLVVLLAAVGLVGLGAREARACSFSPCLYESPRVEAIALHTASPVPRDGAFVFLTDQEESPTCLDELAPNLTIAVSRGGEPVPGEVVQLAALPTALIWRPAALLDAGATYQVRVTVENDGLGPEEDGFGGVCGPSQLLAPFTLTVGDGLAGAPEVVAPAFVAASTSLFTSLIGVACCPGVIPWYEDGGCEPEIYWDFDDPNGCGFVSGFTELQIGALPTPLALPIGHQFVHQLVVDGEVVARTLGSGPVYASRRTAACARLERIHLGTGEVASSAEVCPSAELAATLGPVALDPMLRCDDGQRCATDDYTWGAECVDHDPDAPPFALAWPYDTVLDVRCPDASVPTDSGPALDEGAGCGCSSRVELGGALLLLLLPGLRRRRRIR